MQWAVAIAAVTLVLVSVPTAEASLCQNINVSITYPNQGESNQVVLITTTIHGSCTSDGEDYFAVRVDLVDPTSHGTLSSNSTVIGYNANNFSVKVENNALSPNATEAWALQVNSYLIQAGATSGQYLLNATTLTITIADNPVPEFVANTSLGFVVPLLLACAQLATRRRTPPSH